MQILFWASAALVVYVYIGYPVVLALWARIAGRRTRGVSAGRAVGEAMFGGAGFNRSMAFAEANDAGLLPGVSIIIAARNEAQRLPARIENLLSLDYAGPRQIIVVSDGSTDDPASALAGTPENVELISCPPQGKAAALNVGVAHARYDILVFADARQTFAADALTALVAPFADPRVGAVTGELLLESAASGDTEGVGEGVGLYWRYEKALRRLESTVGSTLGATGAIYAMRRSLWRPLPADTILDDVLAPMRAVIEGYLTVFEDRAKAFDRVTTEAKTEARRKIRTLAGNVQILWLEPRLLLPFTNPVWLQYMSHKVGRLVVPYALIALFVTSVILAETHVLYTLALIGQCGFYLLAAYGGWLAASEPTPVGASQIPSALGVKHVHDA